MKKSLTLHNYNKSFREHNVRSENCVKYMTHINHENTKYNIVLKDEKFTDAYNRLFGEALKEYNAKQKNPNRRINNYLEHVKKSNKNVAYELVLAIGDRETTGSNYNETQKERECLIEYFNTFSCRNPHLECIGFYIHYDEATLHAHLCYIPVATNYKNGLSKQPGLNKALGQQGYFKKDKLTPQMQFQMAEREAFKQICVSKGIEIADNVSDKHKHMEKEQYILYNQIRQNEHILDNTTREIKELKEELQQSKDVLKDLKGEIKTASELKDLTLGTNILGKPNKNVKLPYKDYLDLKETAMLVDDIIDIKNNEILEEKEINKNLKKENFKLFGEKQKAELNLHKASKNIDVLERCLDDYIEKLEYLETELQKEKSYSQSLETYMHNIKNGPLSVLEMYINDNETKLNRQQRRAKDRRKDDFYNYDYDDIRYY